jgi:pre-mRNA-processing factor 19
VRSHLFFCGAGLSLVWGCRLYLVRLRREHLTSSLQSCQVINNQTMAQSNAIQSFACALTGLSPVADPVVTPSGYICSRHLLLTKLVENGGVDPFDDTGTRRLDESSLVELNTGSGGMGLAANPPRPPKASSLPNLLGMIQSEFEAVLLELYDTRMALEEARRELSSALFQNDAAVRVIARLASERDEAREKLKNYLASDGAFSGEAASSTSSVAVVEPHKRERGGEESSHTTKKARVVDEGESTTNSFKTIPSSDLAAMNDTWMLLTKGRRSIAKLKRTDVEITQNESLLGDLAKGEEKKVNLGKSSAKAGILCMMSCKNGLGGGGDIEYVVTGGHDKTAIIYDVSSGKIVATLPGASGDIVTVNGMALSDEGTMWVVTGSADGNVRLYSVSLDGKDGSTSLVGVAELNSGTPMNVIVHPSSTTTEVRVLVGSSEGTVELYKYDVAGSEMKLLTRLEQQNSGGSDGGLEATKYTAGCMHPDGFIYIAGTEDGSLIVWDLKTQAVAGTLRGEGGANGCPINCISISENGYHVATSTFLTSGNSSIQIWDLRKLKSIATISPSPEDVGRVVSLGFDPTATYLAYSGELSTRVCVVKDWDRVVCTLYPSKTGGVKKKGTSGELSGGIVWGGRGFGPKEGGEQGKVWLATGCDGERPIRFWGVE